MRRHHHLTLHAEQQQQQQAQSYARLLHKGYLVFPWTITPKDAFCFPFPSLCNSKKERDIAASIIVHVPIFSSKNQCRSMCDVLRINCFALTLVVEGFVSGRKIPHSPSSRSELAQRSWESEAEKMSRTKTKSLRNLTGEWRSRRRVGGGRSRLWKWSWKDVVWLCNWKQTGWMSLPR